jgi:hypothetical protein
MTYHLKNLDLAHGGFFDDLIILGLFELLYGENLLRVIAFAFEDHSVGALSYNPQNIVFLHNYYHQTISWPRNIQENIILMPDFESKVEDAGFNLH